MIKADNIGAMMELIKANNLRIKDRNNHLLLDINESNPAAAFDKFKEYIPILSAYKSVVIKAGTDANLAQNYSNSAEWIVYFETTVTDAKTVLNSPISGMESKELSEVKMAFELYKKDVEFANRIRALEDKIDNKKGFGLPKEFIPIIGKLVGFKDEQIAAFMATEKTATLSGPDEELNSELEQLWASIEKKVSGNKMLILLRAINKNPSIVDMAINYINSAGLAGPPMEQDFSEYDDITNITTMDDNYFDEEDEY